MTTSQTGPTLPAPSADVRAEALARAERLAAGLFPHQVEGVAFLLGRRRAILADDMGLGKTRQSIVALTAAAPAGGSVTLTPDRSFSAAAAPSSETPLQREVRVAGGPARSSRTAPQALM